MHSEKINNMKRAGYVVALILTKLKDFIKIGTSLNEINDFAAKIMEQEKVKPSFLNYHGFPKVVCTSVNNYIVHGIPNEYKLKNGDIVSVDVGCDYNGYHCDAARTYEVGTISPTNKKLLLVTKKALQKALKQVKDNIFVGDISAAICEFVYKNEMSIPEEFSGHGIGKSLHEKPHIYNIGKQKKGKRLKQGMTIAIEPIVHLGKKDIIIESDGWSAKTRDGTNAAHFEDTILITKKGYQILTSLDQKEVING